MSNTMLSKTRAVARKLVLPVVALAGLVALSGCYYGPYGYYGYPAYAYAPPPVVGGVFIRGGYGYRGYWR